jgi:hypothetical protein
MIAPGGRVAFAQTGAWRGGNWQAGNWGWRGGAWRGANWRFNHRPFRNAFFFGTGLGFASAWPYYYSDYYPTCWWQRVGWTVQQVCSSDYSYY